MFDLLSGLRAVAEPTRLRLLALCAQAELTVSDLTRILGQSQPRISRHLKLLCEAGLLERSREGTWTYYRLAREGKEAALASALLPLALEEGAVVQDRERLQGVTGERTALAETYFRDNAQRWDEVRSLHVDEAEVERAILSLFPDDGVIDFLDIGTGTGRMLELLGSHVTFGTGLDSSREMLSLARTALEKAGLNNCAVRKGNMYALPWPEASFDAVTIHQVLHYADHPSAVISEASRVLRPGGTLLVIDFAPHDLENLRDEHAHVHMGFADGEVALMCRTSGLEEVEATALAGDPLTVTLWRATRSGISDAKGQYEKLEIGVPHDELR